MGGVSVMLEVWGVMEDLRGHGEGVSRGGGVVPRNVGGPRDGGGPRGGDGGVLGVMRWSQGRRRVPPVMGGCPCGGGRVPMMLGFSVVMGGSQGSWGGH